MPRRGDGPPRLMRIVEGLRGTVPMRMELVLRPDYGSITPWMEAAADGLALTAGPDAFRLTTQLPLSVQDGTAASEFALSAGGRERVGLTWPPSYEEAPPVGGAKTPLAR